MNRCLFVATDGSPAASAALFYALDFASALQAHEIACLCVHEENRTGKLAPAPVVTAGEMALATGTPGPIFFELPNQQSRLSIQPDSVLDSCREQVSAAGFRFTPVIASRQPSHVVATTAHLGELIFIGRNSDSARATPSRLGSTVRAVLQSTQQTVVVCPTTHAAIDRIVLLMAGNLCDAELVARGAMWAEALEVPSLIAVPESDRPFARNALEAAERVLNQASIAATGTTYESRPEEFAQKLTMGDLVLVSRRQRYRLSYLWFGNATDRIVEHSIGPVAVMPRP